MNMSYGKDRIITNRDRRECTLDLPTQDDPGYMTLDAFFLSDRLYFWDRCSESDSKQRERDHVVHGRLGNTRRRMAYTSGLRRYMSSDMKNFC